jgi:tetratricopeptide (TPR) repeat protein
MYRAKRDDAAAETWYRKLLTSNQPIHRSRARTYLAGIDTYRGRFKRAIEQYDQGIAADRLEKQTNDWNHYDKFLLKSEIYEQLGDYQRAIVTLQELPTLEGGLKVPLVDATLCEYLAQSGNTDRARRILKLLQSTQGRWASTDVLLCDGMIAFAEGNVGHAITNFEELVRHQSVSPAIWYRFRLARAYQEAGRLSDAVRTYESLHHYYDITWGEDPVAAVVMLYYAGLAYESSGWNDKAIERYEEFLTIWKDADPGIPIAIDAKQRLERLKRGS